MKFKFSVKLFFVLVFVTAPVTMLLAESNIYEDFGIKINFGSGGFSEVELKSGTNENPFVKKNYFSTFTKKIRFCPVSKQPAYMQQVVSESGWMCEFYILPGKSKNEIRRHILNSYVHNKFSHYSEIEELTISKRQILKWRYRIGKTRLDHFLIFGKKVNYLFISSPYGENGDVIPLIETLILR
ncbi:MAG: hypothetical protein OEZ34_15655 [Spirochaetia bacterium]|nr:hypothetical protein [Spirochaetia bacterium]